MYPHVLLLLSVTMFEIFKIRRFNLRARDSIVQCLLNSHACCVTSTLITLYNLVVTAAPITTRDLYLLTLKYQHSEIYLSPLQKIYLHSPPHHHQIIYSPKRFHSQLMLPTTRIPSSIHIRILKSPYSRTTLWSILLSKTYAILVRHY